MLADRVDRVDSFSGLRSSAAAGGVMKRQAHQALSGERRSQPVGGAVQRVALGHGVKLSRPVHEPAVTLDESGRPQFFGDLTHALVPHGHTVDLANLE